MYLQIILIAFAASVIGGICGIGGGVIIKPLLDLFGIASVSAASFMSACSVFSMSLYNVGRNFLDGNSRIELKTTLPLAIGAAVGGIAGSKCFSLACTLLSQQTAGLMQSLMLLLLTLGTIFYTLNKEKIKTHRVEKAQNCLIIGLLLGLLSSFLEIGGGPFNIAVLHYFFSMDTKTTSINSLFIILISQIANLGSTVIRGSVPEVSLILVLLMIFGGITGGIVGHKLNKKMEGATIDKLFLLLMAVIIGICIFNAFGCLSR